MPRQQKKRKVEFHLDATRRGKVDITVGETVYQFDLDREQLLQLRGFIDMLIERRDAPRKPVTKPDEQGDDHEDSSSTG